MLEEIKRLRAIAETGLLYCANDYDRERYEELNSLSFRLLEAVTGIDSRTLKINLPLSKDYPTAKVDIRGLLLSPHNKILLVKESADGSWSLPGGWGDVGFSPKEIVIKEFKEETGLDVVSERLLAVFDKKMHPHPPQPFYVYKLVFLCRAVSMELKPGFDVQGVEYFEIDNLPALSQDRILRSQLELVFDLAINKDKPTYFD